MDEGTQEEIDWAYWRKWYPKQREELIAFAAMIKAQCYTYKESTRPATYKDLSAVMSFVAGYHDYLKNIIDSMEYFRQRIELSAKWVADQNDILESLKQTIDKRDIEITETLERLLNWEQQYQPTLDEARNYFENMAGRIGKKEP